MSSIRGILPWAVVATVAGAGIWWLLGQDSTVGTWLLAAFLAAHGAIHLLFAVPAPEDASSAWPFDMSRSWTVVRLGVGVDRVRIAGRALIALTMVGFVLAALSTLGLLIPTEWWRLLVATSALLSSALLILCVSRQLVVGLAIDAVLLWVALAGLWLP
jgi:hypothetical protein